MVDTSNQSQGLRVALVIGNGDYLHSSILDNPVRDARLMARKLSSVGFEVIEGFDLTYEEQGRKLRDFIEVANGADAAVFFFAGHGLQVDGVNYLVPTDAQLVREGDLDFQVFEVDRLVRRMTENARVSVLFLDACRDNPLARSLGSALRNKKRSAGSGMADMTKSDGAMIMFATQPGETAADGDGKNSPFTIALTENLGKPGVSAGDMAVAVRSAVKAATRQRQRPYAIVSLDELFFFDKGGAVRSPSSSQPPAAPSQEPPAASSPQPTVTPSNEGYEQWVAARKAADPHRINDVVMRFPKSAWEAEARKELARLLDVEWEELIERRDANAMNAFLGKWPNTPHAAQASSVLADIEGRRWSHVAPHPISGRRWMGLAATVAVAVGGGAFYFDVASLRTSLGPTITAIQPRGDASVVARLHLLDSSDERERQRTVVDIREALASAIPLAQRRQLALALARMAQAVSLAGLGDAGKSALVDALAAVPQSDWARPDWREALTLARLGVANLGGSNDVRERSPANVKALSAMLASAAGSQSLQFLIHSPAALSDAAREINTSLQALGWTAAFAPDTEPSSANEVRFRKDSTNGPAAALLAADLIALGLPRTTTTNGNNADISPRRLEIWVSGPVRRWDTPPGPDAAWCYQQDRKTGGADNFLIACHPSKPTCVGARGTRRDTPQSECIFMGDLRSIPNWSPGPGGWGNSWFKYSPTLVPAPFPKP